MAVVADHRRDGIAVSNDGALSLTNVASGSSVPATAVGIKGSAPLFGKAVAPDGALYVRFL